MFALQLLFLDDLLGSAGLGGLGILLDELIQTFPGSGLLVQIHKAHALLEVGVRTLLLLGNSEMTFS